eukprot:gnl/TRDRNA2_/TRDRNA2_181577_c0_seq1.p1 gnl/TRDRNA2_/TRDRNA2_181577_c0~~gnl/TRDRNA2_/TRDRNA2_181577_c0_seq1.p1  ORF type:complete len:495 (-),score=44.73 gnl/TRDRNA2_/TRDRNA2_181577_c0_seq1:42-1457(-)
MRAAQVVFSLAVVGSATGILATEDGSCQAHDCTTSMTPRGTASTGEQLLQKTSIMKKALGARQDLSVENAATGEEERVSVNKTVSVAEVAAERSDRKSDRSKKYPQAIGRMAGDVYLHDFISGDGDPIYVLPGQTVHDHVNKLSVTVNGTPGDVGQLSLGDNRRHYQIADVPWLLSRYSKDDDPDVFDTTLALRVRETLGLGEGSTLKLDSLLQEIPWSGPGQKRYRFMNTVVRALGKSPQLLMQFIADNDFRIKYTYCDQASFHLSHEHNLWLHLYDVPRDGCDSMVSHDHNHDYASYTLAEGMRQSVYARSAAVEKPSSVSECELTKVQGCDPDGDLQLPNFRTDFGLQYIRQVYCGKSAKGESHIFPVNWIHRVRFDGLPKRPGITVFFSDTRVKANTTLYGVSGPDPEECPDCKPPGSDFTEALLSYLLDSTGKVEFDVKAYSPQLQPHSTLSCTWEPMAEKVEEEE